MMGLPDGERISMILSAVLPQSTRVTDGRTELAWHIRAIAYMLSRVKIVRILHDNDCSMFRGIKASESQVNIQAIIFILYNYISISSSICCCILFLTNQYKKQFVMLHIILIIITSSNQINDLGWFNKLANLWPSHGHGTWHIHSLWLTVFLIYFWYFMLYIIQNLMVVLFYYVVQFYTAK